MKTIAAAWKPLAEQMPPGFPVGTRSALHAVFHIGFVDGIKAFVECIISGMPPEQVMAWMDRIHAEFRDGMGHDLQVARSLAGTTDVQAALDAMRAAMARSSEKGNP